MATKTTRDIELILPVVWPNTTPLVTFGYRGGYSCRTSDRPLDFCEVPILPITTNESEPGRSFRAIGTALRAWTPRQFVAAVGFSILFALLIGIPTVMIPNPIFGREIAVLAWNYPVWIGSSILAGMLAATYVRPSSDTPKQSLNSDGDKQSKLGMAGGVLAWFAVGCPVCNKLALLALGYSGAITWFAPIQPLLAVGALLLTGGALLFRLRGQVYCPTGIKAGTETPATEETVTTMKEAAR